MLCNILKKVWERGWPFAVILFPDSFISSKARLLSNEWHNWSMWLVGPRQGSQSKNTGNPHKFSIIVISGSLITRGFRNSFVNENKGDVRLKLLQAHQVIIRFIFFQLLDFSCLLTHSNELRPGDHTGGTEPQDHKLNERKVSYLTVVTV
jgi:hypothetical protein